MATNWFEGGRRISKLGMGIVVAAGVASIMLRNDPNPTLSIRGPTMPWFVAQTPCPENAYSHYLWDYDWGGEKPGLQLCFLPLPDGRIPYSLAPTPPEELEKQAVEKRENEKRIAKGEPPTLTINSPWFYGGREYDDKVQAYVSESASTLTIAPEVATRLRESVASLRWDARRKAIKEAALWVAGLCGFLWVFTFVMGWIIRGFAGIATGQDFRSAKAEGEGS